jgi:hypothetical protein
MREAKPDVATAAPPAAFLDPSFAVEAQQRTMTVMSEATEVMTRTASAIWQKQLDILRIETDQARSGANALVKAEQPGVAIDAYLSGLRGGFESTLADMRDINDMMRDCCWRLFDLYADTLRQGPPPPSA